MNVKTKIFYICNLKEGFNENGGKISKNKRRNMRLYRLSKEENKSLTQLLNEALEKYLIEKIRKKQ